MNQRLFKFVNCFNMEVELVENDQYSEQYSIEDQFCIYFDKQEQTFTLQGVDRDPGTYLDPPSEDFWDIYTDKKLDNVLVKLMECYSKMVLDNLSEEEFYEKYQKGELK